MKYIYCLRDALTISLMFSLKPINKLAVLDTQAVPIIINY